jgi:DNA replication protein DnaC
MSMWQERQGLPATASSGIADCSGSASVATPSNLPFGRWGEVFGDEVVAAAMIDRLVHHAEVLTLAGDSYRTKARRELLAKDRNK